ncbi:MULTISPECIES: hypothetical protein [unclassified Microcoleus]
MVGWESTIVARLLHPYKFIGIRSIAQIPKKAIARSYPPSTTPQKKTG